ncbi:MAG TPA: AraC family transcriptional regulator [Opitutaceae bacterium]|jgi:AraC-like DNA-binding protein
MHPQVLRRDGFSGQHMLVLPAPLQADARRHPLLRHLCVTDAGYFPNAGNHFVSRPRGAPTALAVLCLQGRGWVRTGKASRTVRPGDFVWLRANVGHAYGSGAKDPWTIVWAHAAGTELPGWEELLGVDGMAAPAVLSLPDDRLEEPGFDRVYAALERGFSIRHLVAAAAALRLALSTVAQLSAEGHKSRSAEERVAQSIEALRSDWQRPHRLGELATAAKVSVAHYSSLFRQRTGFSPIDFLIRLRVRHACRLLDTTSITVKEVSERSGYADPYYFTRCFRRVMGASPRAYRKTPKG